MSSTPTFKDPPIVEFVLGVQFFPLTKLTAGHFGLFWKELGSDWVPEDSPPLPDQFELFDRPKWQHRRGVRFQLGPMTGAGRFVLRKQSRDRLIQIQATRFYFNWRKTSELKPGYNALIDEFEAMLERFRKFVVAAKLGEPNFNQWEITYVDSYPQGDYWRTPADWESFLPGLFGDLFTVHGLTLEHRAAEWSFEIEPKKGRLHIAAQPGRWCDEPNDPSNGQSDSLIVTTTARGPIGKSGVETLREGLDLGHEMAVQSFLKTTSADERSKWEEMQ